MCLESRKTVLHSLMRLLTTLFPSISFSYFTSLNLINTEYNFKIDTSERCWFQTVRNQLPSHISYYS